LDDIRAALELALGLLPEQDYDLLINAVVTSEYKAGDLICREGRLEHILYIIQDGTVAFTKKMDQGEQFLGIRSKGDFFGELGVLDHAPRAATVHAISDCKLIEIHENTLNTILTRSPSVSRAIMRGLTRTVRDTDQITIAELQLKIEELARTLDNLRAAQAELVRRERLKRDLEIAAQVHKDILPTSFPNIPNFEFAAVARPAREIGGDLYDVIALGDNHVGIVMADASGKSVQAAIYMATVRALFLSQARAERPPTQVAEYVHNLLLKVSTAEMFVTAFYANLNYHTRRMSYIRGGHDRPIYYRAATQEIRLLDPPGRFLGLLPNLILEEASLTLEPGDMLVCYSDGVTDATRRGDNTMYGLEKLRAFIAKHSHHSAQKLVELIIEDVDNFRDGEEQPDDLTLLVTKAL
jgi:sigma-B regulation protein RsbU (phosphoserine phosphatase)